MLDSSRVIPVEEYRRDLWSNGLGITREIARGLAGGQPGLSSNGIGVPGPATWAWRLSIADIEQDSAYSTFHDVRREQVLLSGNGLQLEFDDGGLVELEPPHGRTCFDGARGAHARLSDGPVQVFNLMWRPQDVSAELLHRPLAGSMLFFIEPCVLWAIHLLSGRADFGVASGLPSLRSGDTALLMSDAVGRRHVLEGGGEILAVRFATHGRSGGGVATEPQ